MFKKLSNINDKLAAIIFLAFFLRVLRETCNRRGASISPKINPVPIAMTVKHLMREIRIERFSKSRHLIFYQGIHRKKQKPSHGARARFTFTMQFKRCLIWLRRRRHILFYIINSGMRVACVFPPPAAI